MNKSIVYIFINKWSSLNTWRFSTFFQVQYLLFNCWPSVSEFGFYQLHNAVLFVNSFQIISFITIWPHFEGALDPNSQNANSSKLHHYKAFSIKCHPIWRTPPCSWLPFPSCHHLSSGPRAHCPLIRYARSAVATDDPGKTSLCPREGRVTLQKPKTNCTAPLQSTFAGKIKKTFGEEISFEELNSTIALYCKAVVGDFIQCPKDPLYAISEKNIWKV